MRRWGFGALLLLFSTALAGQESTSDPPTDLEGSADAALSTTITVSKCLQGLGHYSASVPSVTGHSYTWSVPGGSVVSGQGTASIVFAAAPPATQMIITVTDAFSGCSLTSTDYLQTNFLDVTGGTYYNYICAIGRRGITAGCGSGYYCSASPVTRGQMAVFLGKAEHTSSWTPSACTGVFSDVPCSRGDAPWIEQLYRELITAGCGTDTSGHPLYCPDVSVLRWQMAVFLVKMTHNPYVPPPSACGCVYSDVTTSTSGANFIETLASDGGVVPGTCSGSAVFCPTDATLRDQMAGFISLAFNLSVP